MLIDVLISSRQAFGTAAGPGTVRRILRDSPLDVVLRIFTSILHRIESASFPAKEALIILPLVASPDTVRAIQRELARMQRQGAQRVAIFPPLLLLNFLKEAIGQCNALSGPITAEQQEGLLRAYWATHDHFAKSQGSPSEQSQRLSEDLLSQIFWGESGRFILTIPRYWALWITLPKRLGTTNDLVDFLPSGFPRGLSASVLPLLVLWVLFFARREQFQPLTLDESKWNPSIVEQVKVLIEQIALDAPAYKQRLAGERAQLRANEHWEYSFMTISQAPLIQVKDAYYCLSLRRLGDLSGEGLYHRMRHECRGDKSRIRALGKLFGDAFHEYVYDLWQRIAGQSRVHRLFKGKSDEVGDGVVMIPDGVILYDAKSRRPALPVVRSGNLDKFIHDMEGGVLGGVRQLDAAVSKLRTMSTDELPQGMNQTIIYPVVVTATSFPEVGFVYEQIDLIAAKEGLLQQQGVAPVQVIDVQSLELIEALGDRGIDGLALLTERAGSPERNKSLHTLLYERYGGLRPSDRMQRAFFLILESLTEWLSTGRVDEMAVDRVLYPDASDQGT